jgi:hypothetical protein
MQDNDTFLKQQEILIRPYIAEKIRSFLSEDEEEEVQNRINLLKKFPGLEFRELVTYCWLYTDEYGEDCVTRTLFHPRENDSSLDYDIEKEKTLLLFYLDEKIQDETNIHSTALDTLRTFAYGLKQNYFYFVLFQTPIRYCREISSKKILEICSLINYVHFLDGNEQKRVMTGQEFHDFYLNTEEQKLYLFRVQLLDEELDRYVFDWHSSYNPKKDQ